MVAGVVIVGADGPAVVISARTAVFLEQHGRLSALRVRVRGINPEVSRELEELRYVAMSHCHSGSTSAAGSRDDRSPEVAAPSQVWMSSEQASRHLDLTGRAVRLACHEGRLPAERVGGRWRISSAAVAEFGAGRAGRAA